MQISSDPPDEISVHTLTLHLSPGLTNPHFSPLRVVKFKQLVNYPSPVEIAEYVWQVDSAFIHTSPLYLQLG